MLILAYNALSPGGMELSRTILAVLFTISFAAFSNAQSPEQKTARYLDSVRNQPSLLLAFLHDVLKGGDLHNHLTGSTYAEDMIDWAA